MLALASVAFHLVAVAPAFSEPVLGLAFALVGCLPLPLVLLRLRMTTFRALAFGSAGAYLAVGAAFWLVGGTAYVPGALLLLAAAVAPSLSRAPRGHVQFAARVSVVLLIIWLATALLVSG